MVTAKRFRVVWADTNATLMIVEAENARQAIARALRGTEILNHDVKSYEVDGNAA